jgi:hypothetical protein
MLLNIRTAANAIAAAVTAIMTVGQWCRRNSLTGMQPDCLAPPCSQEFFCAAAGVLAAIPTATEAAMQSHRFRRTVMSKPPYKSRLDLKFEDAGDFIR